MLSFLRVPQGFNYHNRYIDTSNVRNLTIFIARSMNYGRSHNDAISYMYENSECHGFVSHNGMGIVSFIVVVLILTR